MKHLFAILLLSVSLGYAQELAVSDSIPSTAGEATSPADILLKTEDFKQIDGRMVVENIRCTIQNGDVSDTVLVSVVCQQQAFDELGIEKINDMIRVTNRQVRNSLKAEHIYSPKEIKMAYFPDSKDWSLTNSFTEQDADGVVKEGLLSVNFDDEGKFDGMMRIL